MCEEWSGWCVRGECEGECVGVWSGWCVECEGV